MKRRVKSVSEKNGKDYLYLIWKHPETRRQYIVGILSKNGVFEFEYGKDVEEARKNGFKGIAAFDEFDKKYKSEKLFPVFASRLPDKKRRGISDILKKYNLKGSIHCFSGSVEMAREFIKLGYKIGIGGIITYKNAKTIKEVVKDTDLAYILLETDSPYLTPVPHRGEDNSPKYIPIIADEIASIKGTPSLDIARVTTANAEAVFDFSCEK